MEMMNIRRKEIIAMQAGSRGILYEDYNLSFDGTAATVINTGAYLFTQRNVNRDFEFIAEGIVGVGVTGGNDQTIICAKHNGNAYGFLVRASNGTSTSYNGTVHIKSQPASCTVIVRRVDGQITLTGENITNPTVRIVNNVFDWPLVLGCAINDNGAYFRYAAGTIEHVLIRWL